MATLLEIIVNGVSSGAVYALIALGFVIIFKATSIINFAQPSLLLAGGYTIAALHDDTRGLVARIGFLPDGWHTPIGFLLAVLAGIAVTATLAAAVEFFILRRMRGGDHSVLSIVTIGVEIVITVELARRIGTQIMPVGDPWGDSVVTFGGATIAHTRLAAIGVAIVAIGAFLLAFKYTSWGVAMRASAERRETAALMGIRLGRVSAGAWAVAGVFAVLAAVFLCVFPTPGLDRGTHAVALKALPAAALGGLDSTTGALVGGLLIGITEAGVIAFQADVALFGHGFADIAPFLLMLAILLARPAGLFGTREATRV